MALNLFSFASKPPVILPLKALKLSSQGPEIIFFCKLQFKLHSARTHRRQLKALKL